MAIFDNDDLRDMGVLTKALGDETRLRALCALRSDELCVCQLVELLGLAQSTVSKHMSILHQARLVECRRQGRWMHYRLAGQGAAPAVRAALAWVLAALGQDGSVVADAARVRLLVREHNAAQQAPCERHATAGKARGPAMRPRRASTPTGRPSR